MNVFRQAPFSRILPAFISGIILFRLNWISLGSYLLLPVVVFLFLIAFLKKKFDRRLLPGILFQIIFLCLGYLITYLHDDRNSDFYFTKTTSAKLYSAKLESKPAITHSGFRAIAQLKGIIDKTQTLAVCGSLYLYLEGDSASALLRAGDEIIFSKRPEEMKAPLNPGQFDFKAKAELKNIFHQVRLQAGDWKFVRSPKRLHLIRLAEGLRDDLLATYKKAGIVGSEYAVLSALVLGYDDEIDRTIMTAFSGSGTMHILSVSGMHVGLVFTLLSFFFRKMEGKRYWWLVRLFSIVLILWFYALLTGLSPSVIRSAMMFSFILIGKSIRRDSNIYNTLAASILVISICFDPLLIFSVGFQLSYLAVAGISFFYPYIFKWFYFKGKYTSMVWQVTAVSLAAQLATLPVSIYYFHLFPNYFILGNLLIIPVSTIGIFAGIFLFFFRPWTWLLIKAGWATGKIIWLQNFLAIKISGLPLAVSNELYLSGIEMFLLYGAIATFSYWLIQKSVRSFRLALLMTIVFLTAFVIRISLQESERELIVFSNARTPVFQINRANKSFLFYTDSVQAMALSDQALMQRKMYKSHRVPILLTGNVEYNNEFVVTQSAIVFSSMLIKWKADTLKKQYDIQIYYGDTIEARRLDFSNRKSKSLTDPYDLRKGAVVMRL